MNMRLIRPISSVEFAHMMQKVKLPVNWSETVAVANSGGPDSICLLFLLNRYIKELQAVNIQENFPKRLVSLTIDHDLQASSADMARHASAFAKSLDVEHFSAKLPWGKGTHPHRPAPGDKMEEQARDMRYTALMELMIGSNANALALGHHCDDQVETMLMRLGRGSRQLGLAGMKPCRRWGMGTRKKGHIGLYQVEEMRRWIIRPLLSVGKDRILATCEEQKLEYTTDPTNFQPHLTIRNAIRHVLNNGGLRTIEKRSGFAHCPPSISSQLTGINLAAKEESVDFDLASSLEHLKDASAKMSSFVQDIDMRVDQLLANCRLPSPSGTFMISPPSLMKIDSAVVQEALIYRVVRYVSPEPWGSPRSELGRRILSVNRLWKHLSDFQQYRSRNNNSICVGSGVWWRLVSMGNGRLRSNVQNTDSSMLAWIALRQPDKCLGNVSHPLRMDITERITKARGNWLAHKISPELEIIFDNRFILRIFVDRIPASILESIARDGIIFVEPRRIWVVPQVTHLDGEKSTVIHSDINQEPFCTDLRLGSEKYQNVKSDWICVDYFRPLSAI